jgi:hypothetical protein
LLFKTIGISSNVWRRKENGVSKDIRNGESGIALDGKERRNADNRDSRRSIMGTEELLVTQLDFNNINNLNL